MQDFRNLEVWNKAHKLALHVYRLTENFPRTEVFGLSIQLRRGAASIATNLAEGCGRAQAEFGRFVQIAFGSACEVEYQLLLSRDLGLIATEQYEATLADVLEIKRMLNGLLKRVPRDVRPLAPAVISEQVTSV
jgi:four helix bundle protein